MTKQMDPKLVDVPTFAMAGTPLLCTETLAQFPRLAAEVLAGEPSVQWSVAGELRDAAGQAQAPWLHVQAQTQLPMQCQNCLEVVQVDLQLDRWFRFVKDEASALREDETSEEDVLVLSDRFDLRSLVEDELLMALPMVARHDKCTTDAGASQGASQLPVPDHPFAVLAAWKH